MIHHSGHIRLRQVVKTGSFRKNPPNQFMVDLDRPFLIRTASVTVVDTGPLKAIIGNSIIPILELLRIGEFAAVVRDDHGEEAAEQFPAKTAVKPFKDINHGLGRVCVPQESQHQGGLHEMDREQAFAANRSDYRIHLDNCCIRILLHKGLELLIGVPNTAALVDLEFRFLMTGSISDFPGKIDVPHFKKAVIDVVVDRFFTAHQIILMGDVDL